MFDELWYCEALQRYAFWKNGALWQADYMSQAGGVWRCKVLRRAQALGGAFVDLGESRALLSCEGESIPAEGSVLLVRLVEAAHGEKLAVCGLHPTLADTLVVYCPHRKGVAFSRTLSRAQQNALRAVLPDDAEGFVVRSAATVQDAPAIAAQMQRLRAQWQAWQQGGALGQVYAAPTDYKRYFAQAAMVRTDRAQYAQGAATDIVYDADLADKWRQTVDPQLAALGECVDAAQGVRLVIQHTEACWVVDVNSARYPVGNNADAAAYNVNCIAAAEVVRQLCLRNVQGVVVVDFINMKADMRQRFWAYLQEQAAADERLHLVDMTQLGLVEMTRSGALR